MNLVKNDNRVYLVNPRLTRGGGTF